MFSDRIHRYTGVPHLQLIWQKSATPNWFSSTFSKENESGAFLCTNLYDMSRYGLQCKTGAYCTLLATILHISGILIDFCCLGPLNRLVGHVHRWRINGLCDESQPLTKFLQCQKICVAVLQCDSSCCSRGRALVLDKKCHVTHRAPITWFFIKLHNICPKLLLINIMTQAFSVVCLTFCTALNLRNPEYWMLSSHIFLLKNVSHRW